MPDLNVSLVLRMIDRLSGPLAGAVKGVSNAGAVTAATSAKLTKLGETEKAIGGFARLKAGTADTAAKLQAAQANVARYAHAMRLTAEPSKAMTAAFSSAKREAAALKAAHGDLQIKTEGARRSLAAMGVSTRDLGSEQRRLKTEIDATTRAAERETKSVERMAKLKGLVGGTGGIGGTLAGVAGTAGAGLGAKASITAAGDLEHGLAALGNTLGASDAELVDYRVKILGVARIVNQSATSMLESMQILGGKGLDKDAALAALAPIGKTATATQASVADLSNTAFTLIDTMKIKPEELPLALDMLAKSADLGGFELKNMARYFPMLTSAASQLGIKGKEGIATLGSALQVALKGAGDPAEAANNMANFLKAMTTEETAKNFQKHGINLKKRLVEGVAKGGNPIEVMMKLIGKTAGVDLEKEMAKEVAGGKDWKEAADAVGKKFKLGELFNDAQVLNFLGPMMANFKEYKRIKDETLGASGAVDDKFAKMMATWNEQTTRATGAVSGLSEAVGHALIPVLLPMVKGVADGVVGLTDLVNAHPQATAAVVGLAGGFLGLRTALGVFRLISGVAGVVGLLPGPIGLTARALPMLGGGLRIAGLALPFVATGVRAIGLALAANPVGAIITGIAIAATLIYTYWDDIAPWFQALWAKVEAVFAWAKGMFWKYLSWTPLALVIANWDGIVGWFGGFWDRTRGAVDAGIATVTGVISGWSPLATISTAWDGVKGYFTGLWDEITGIAGRALDWIDTKIQSAIGWITGIRDKIGSTVDWVASSLGLSGASDKPTVAGVAPPQAANLNVPPPANDTRPARLPVAAAGGGPTSYTFALTFTLNGVISDTEVKRMVDQAKDELERKFMGLSRDLEARRAALYDHG